MKERTGLLVLVVGELRSPMDTRRKKVRVRFAGPKPTTVEVNPVLILGTAARQDHLYRVLAWVRSQGLAVPPEVVAPPRSVPPTG